MSIRLSTNVQKIMYGKKMLFFFTKNNERIFILILLDENGSIEIVKNNMKIRTYDDFFFNSITT